MKDVSNFSREELLENINNSLGLLNKFKQIEYQIKSYYKNDIPPIYEKITVIAALILLFPVIMIESKILGFFLGIFGSILGFLGGFVTIFFFVLFMKSKIENNFKQKQEKYLKENEEKLDELNIELGQIAETVFQTTVVPADYVDQHALEKFSIYLSNYRASSLSECINLYENELQAQYMRDELSQLRQEQQVTNQMLSEARSELSMTNRKLSDINVSLDSISHETYKNNFHN